MTSRTCSPFAGLAFHASPAGRCVPPSHGYHEREDHGREQQHEHGGGHGREEQDDQHEHEDQQEQQEQEQVAGTRHPHLDDDSTGLAPRATPTTLLAPTPRPTSSTADHNDDRDNAATTRPRYGWGG